MRRRSSNPGRSPRGEFLRAHLPVELRLILRRCRMLAVGVGMITDLVPGERLDHVLPSPAFESPALFSHYLEGGLDSLLGQEVRDALGGAIALGNDVVLGIEPQQHVHRALGWRARRLQRGAPACAEHHRRDDRECAGSLTQSGHGVQSHSPWRTVPPTTRRSARMPSRLSTRISAESASRAAHAA